MQVLPAGETVPGDTACVRVCAVVGVDVKQSQTDRRHLYQDVDLVAQLYVLLALKVVGVERQRRVPVTVLLVLHCGVG